MTSSLLLPKTFSKDPVANDLRRWISAEVSSLRFGDLRIRGRSGLRIKARGAEFLPVRFAIGLTLYEFDGKVSIVVLHIDGRAGQQFDCFSKERGLEFGDRRALALPRGDVEDVLRLIVSDAGKRKRPRVIVALRAVGRIIPIAKGNDRSQKLPALIPMQPLAKDRTFAECLSVGRTIDDDGRGVR